MSKRHFIEQFDNYKYGDLISKKNNQNKHYFLLSELIDNSISSWDKNKKSNNEELNIKIIPNLKDNTIICIDDAYGMNQKDLEDSIRQNNFKEGNVINKFGVGMKNCVWYFGQDLEIWTKSEEENEVLYTSIKASENDPNQPIKWIVEENHHDNDDWKLESRGTKIKISNCWEGRIPKEHVWKNEIIEILSRKFYYWIKRGVNIHIIGINGYGNKFDISNKRIEAQEIKSQVIPKECVKKFRELCEEFLVDLDILDSNTVNEIVSKGCNGEPIEFSIYHKIGSKGPFKFDFGVQKQLQNNSKSEEGYRKLYGIGTMQKDRYINIPNVNVEEGQKWDYTRKNIKRMWGLVDFGDEFKIDNNKKSFDFENDLEEWEIFKTKIGRDLLKICDVVKQTLDGNKRSKVVPNNDIESNKQNARYLSSKAEDKQNIHWSYDESNESYNLFYYDYHVIIYENSLSIDDESYFFVDYQYTGDKEFSIFFNANHNVLKPLVENSENDFNKSFLPLIAMFGILNAYIDTKITNDFFERIWPNKDNSFKGLMNEILKSLSNR